MEYGTWLRLVLLIPITQDLLDSGVYSMKSTFRCNNPNHYPHMQSKSHWRCCLKCPTGTRVEQHCIVNNPNTTQCTTCPTGQYQPEANGDVFCKQCANNQHKANRILLSNCTSTHNREYGACMSGFYYNTVLDFCEKCKSCPAGFGVEQECTKTRNTKCSAKKCTVGKYSDQDSHTQRCENCKPCDVDEEMFRECTATTNYGCRVRIVSTPTKYVVTGEVLTTGLLGIWPTGSNGVKSAPSSNRSWVMPFFVSAMALLLLMFVVFVIGVTIWCHRHSRKKEDRETMAETPMIETKCQEETITMQLSKELKPDRYQLVAVPKKIVQESDMLLREVSHDIIEELASYLNPGNNNNWKKVATMLGYSWDVIRNLELNPTLATQTMLERWGTKRDATVFALYTVLKQIDRDDAADVLERVLTGSCASSPRSV